MRTPTATRPYTGMLTRMKNAGTLDRAIEIAASAHAGQLDKAGQPYILHPLRVMLRVQSDQERIAAVLHDLLEDTHWRREDLDREGFSPVVLDALDALTRRKDESYEDFIERLTSNAVARRVKLADLEDNMNLDRLPHPSDEDLRRLEKYRRAHAVILASQA